MHTRMRKGFWSLKKFNRITTPESKQAETLDGSSVRVARLSGLRAPPHPRLGSWAAWARGELPRPATACVGSGQAGQLRTTPARPGHPPRPAPRGSLPEARPDPGGWLPLPTARWGARLARLLQDPPAPGGPPRAPRPGQRLPARAASAPHLLGRHRPLPRAAPTVLAGATAALRHLRRLRGFRRAA